MINSQVEATQDQNILIPSRVHQERNLIVRIGLEPVIVVCLLLVIFGVRTLQMNYNTLFIDEALYSVFGAAVLHGDFDRQSLTWMSGSYIYPIFAALVDQISGMHGLRITSAVLSTLTAVLVYLTTRHIFRYQAAVWALLLFGLAGVSIFIGQFAVYEALGAPLLACSVYLITISGRTGRRIGWFTLIGASLCFVLAVLVKYVLVLYLPAQLLILLALALYYSRPFAVRLIAFFVPLAVSIGIYGLLYYNELRALLVSNAVFQTGEFGTIWGGIWEEIGLALILAALGGLIGFFAVLKRQGQPVAWRIAWLVLVPLLGVALLALPLYHLAAGNLRSVGKHAIYSLVLLAPLAGLCCDQIVLALLRYRAGGAVLFQVISAVISICIAVALCNQAFDRVWGWQHSWPNASETISFLRESKLPANAPVLAEGAQIYLYHLGIAPQYQHNWLSTWSFDYAGTSGVAAMQAAIQNHYFIAVVLDDYYTPGVRAQLEPALAAAGYRRSFARSQSLSTGATILTTVYLQPEASQTKSYR